MKLAKDIKTVAEVSELSNEEMFYIDKYLSQDNNFNSEEIASAFSTEWVVRGM
jgi:hypothetical protein